MRSFLFPVLAIALASCKTNAPQTNIAALPSTCILVTNAINNGNWPALRKIVRPGMLANAYLDSAKSNLDYSVGKLLLVQNRPGTGGRTNQVYSFALENKDGTPNPHWLQITIHNDHDRPELVDFWNFGW